MDENEENGYNEENNDEEFENDEDFTTDANPPMGEGGGGGGGPQEFSSEHYNYLGSLYTSDYTPMLVFKIKESHLSPAAKRAFIATIMSFFSQTAFLSHQKDVEIAEIDLDMALNILTQSCNKVDINLPEYPHLIELIKSHYNRFIISRTTGPERERVLQNKTTYENISRIASDEEKKKKTRGLGIISKLLGKGED